MKAPAFIIVILGLAVGPAAAESFTSFPLPVIYPNSGLQVITAGPDGNLCFTESETGQIGRITPAGVVTEFPLVPGSGPEGIAAGPDGNIWFTESDSNHIGRITPTGFVTELATSGSDPSRITVGPDGNLWFTEFGSNQIGRITTAGVVTEFPSKAKALVKGKGTNLPDDLVPPLQFPVAARLINDENGTCFEGVYSSDDMKKNDEKQFKAKGE